MEVTELGMETEVRPVQPENAELPMEVTELGMETEVKTVQSENAELPMEVTELGMETMTSLPMYAIRVSRLELEYTKTPSVTPFIEIAPHRAPKAVP